MRGSTAACALALALAFLLSGPALAISTGIIGSSGKNGSICNDCHGGGSAPMVRFEGPQEVVAGAIATFRFVIESQASSQSHAGFNVAASAGELAIAAGQGGARIGVELTHTGPKPNDDNGSASFEFTWTAPAAAGGQTLFGAGNSVNRNFISTGDRAAATTLAVNVIVPAPTPTATALPTCSGDCSEDGEATIEEMVAGVNVARGINDIGVCPAADIDGNGSVEIIELMVAIESALLGCAD